MYPVTTAKSSMLLASSAAFVLLLSATQVSAETIRIDVGEDGASVFSPDTVTAKEGDVLEYHFHGPTAHDVVMGAFDSPCRPTEDGGFYSGLVSVRGDDESDDVFRVTVNSTDSPIWFYCSVRGHCSDGMVGVVNPPDSGDETLDAYRQEAENAREVTPNGDVFGGVLGPAPDTPTDDGGDVDDVDDTPGDNDDDADDDASPDPSPTEPSSPGATGEGSNGDGSGGMSLRVSYLGVLGGLMGAVVLMV